MADEIVKKITIPRSEIQSVSSDGLYFLRYRVVSEDKTRASHWSQIYSLNGKSLNKDSSGTPYTQNIISLIQETNGISIAWGILNTLNTSSYDAYVRYDDSTTSAWNGMSNTTATELTGFVATLSTTTNLVTLTTGTTANIKVGQLVTKTSVGGGDFNGLGVYVISITGATTFTVGSINGAALNHAANGSITFKVVGRSFEHYVSTTNTTLFLPKPTVGTKVYVAVLAQSYPKYSKLASFSPTKPPAFLVESVALTVV
jgi:hypothetical protein